MHNSPPVLFSLRYYEFHVLVSIQLLKLILADNGGTPNTQISARGLALLQTNLSSLDAIKGKHNTVATRKAVRS